MSRNNSYFTEQNSAEVVIARNDAAKNARLADCMAIMTKHIHAAVKEMEPTNEEWFQMIQFLQPSATHQVPKEYD